MQPAILPERPSPTRTKKEAGGISPAGQEQVRNSVAYLRFVSTGYAGAMLALPTIGAVAANPAGCPYRASWS